MGGDRAAPTGVVAARAHSTRGSQPLGRWLRVRGLSVLCLAFAGARAAAQWAPTDRRVPVSERRWRRRARCGPASRCRRR